VIQLIWKLTVGLWWRRLWCRHSSTQTSNPLLHHTRAMFEGRMSREEYRVSSLPPIETVCLLCGKRWVTTPW
jgi:hypothetical protein